MVKWWFSFNLLDKGERVFLASANWLFFSLYDFHAESSLADYVNIAKDKLFPELFYQD